MMRMSIRHRVRVTLLAAALVGPGAAAVAAAAATTERQALPMPGKTSLYQRVLTRPGAALRDAPGAAARPDAEVPPLSVFYVYDRRPIQGKDWLELGTAAADAATGWLPAAEVIDWRQTLTVAFTRNADRDPALFFRDRGDLLGLLGSETLVPETERLRASIREGRIPEGFPVIAKEPDTYVDPNRQFYLLPILAHEQVDLESWTAGHGPGCRGGDPPGWEARPARPKRGGRRGGSSGSRCPACDARGLSRRRSVRCR